MRGPFSTPITPLPGSLFHADPQIGVVGFSAGAYLAADLAIGPQASRPDFVGLIYGGLRTPVPAGAPPAFIAGAADDDYQPNDPVLLYQAWRRSGAAAELHLYERGGHGFDLRPQGTTSDHWFDEFIWWLEARRLTAPVTSGSTAATGTPSGGRTPSLVTRSRRPGP